MSGVTIDLTPGAFLTPEECRALAEAMEKKYAVAIGQRRFSITASQSDEAVEVQVLLASGDESFYYPVEARIKHGAEDLTAGRAAVFLIDYIDLYFEEFLMEEDEELFLPIDWANHEWDTVNFQIRGQILNRKAEALADALLEADAARRGECEIH